VIKITTLSGLSHILKPTIFPDGTSQVWKLPDEILESKELDVTWNFEAERELIDLLSFRQLVPNRIIDLHIPFLPYARQDKWVSNTATFNLVILADIINSLHCREVTAVDVHNPEVTTYMVNNFRNVEVTELHKLLIAETNPDYLVFPDMGALERYAFGGTTKLPRLICHKERNPLTGDITGHTMTYRDTNTDVTILHVNMATIAKPGQRFLIVDDLCDGGATFISIANKIKGQIPDVVIDLFVTHGIFSKGKEHLLTSGINNIYTTNSLLKNADGYQV
jgi:ribose-phosphate pyrophosphokinase